MERLQRAQITSQSRPAGCAAPRPGRRRAALVVRARARGSRRAWLEDAWERDGAGAAPPEQVITIFGADGAVTRFPALPHAAAAAARLRGRRRGAPPPLPAPADQGLCLPSLFEITASNGADATRRLAVLGFCQSVEHLHEAVAAAVARRGGEVFAAEARESGLHARLSMAVALPLLFGVPPEHEHLRAGIAAGGGIVDRVVREWLLCRG